MTGRDESSDPPTPASDGEDFVLDLDEEFLVDLEADDPLVLEDDNDEFFLITEDELVGECEEEVFVLDETRAGVEGHVGSGAFLGQDPVAAAEASMGQMPAQASDSSSAAEQNEVDQAFAQQDLSSHVTADSVSVDDVASDGGADEDPSVDLVGDLRSAEGESFQEEESILGDDEEGFDEESLAVFDESFAEAEDPAPSLENSQVEDASTAEGVERPGVLPDLSEWAELPDEAVELTGESSESDSLQEVEAQQDLESHQELESLQELDESMDFSLGADGNADPESVPATDPAGLESVGSDAAPPPVAEETFEDLVNTFAASESEPVDEEPSLESEIETAWYGLEAGSQQAGADTGTTADGIGPEGLASEDESQGGSEAAATPSEGLDDADWFMADSAQELAASPSHEDASLAAEWSDDLVGVGADGFDAVNASADDLAALENLTSSESSREHQGAELGDDWDTEFPDMEGSADVDQGEDWEDDLAQLRESEGSSSGSGSHRRVWLPLMAASLLLGACWAAWEMLKPMVDDPASTGQTVAVVPPEDGTPTTDPAPTTDPNATTEPPVDGGQDPTPENPEVGNPEVTTDPSAAGTDPASAGTDPVTDETPEVGDVVPSDPTPPADPMPEITTGPVTAADVDPVAPAVSVSPQNWWPNNTDTTANGEAAIVDVLTSNNEVVSLRPGETIVELPNGHYFKGRMKRLRYGKLTLADGRAEYTFDLSEIRILDAADPEYRSVNELPKASVILENGQRLRGRLVKETESHVVLAYESGRVMVPRADVASVSFTGRVHF